MSCIVPWSEVHEEAGRLEHAISPRLEAYLVRLLGDPGTCPHGNPIPGSANLRDHGPLVPLAAVTAGKAAVVRRIDERLESQYERMRALESDGLLPGCQFTVTAVDADAMQLRVDGEDVRVPIPVAVERLRDRRVRPRRRGRCCPPMRKRSTAGSAAVEPAARRGRPGVAPAWCTQSRVVSYSR